MADVSPDGVPDQGATPPAPEAPTSALPASSAPAPQSAPAARPFPGEQPAQAFSAGQTAPIGLSAPYTATTDLASGYPPAALLPTHTEATATAPDAWRDPVTGRARHGWRRWLPIAAVISLILAGAIGMLLFLGVNFGGVALAVGLVAAVIPVPLLVAAFFWLDRYEPEPIHLLAFCFAWGATVATSVALLVNTGAAWLFDKAGLSESLVAVLIAPLIEESMKASGPLLLFWRRREEWSGITDGIVYCGLSALGFAMVENVLYLGGHGYAAGAEQYGAATGLQNVFAIFIVRILFTGFAHPLFTSMTGIGLGVSSRSGDRRVRWLAPLAGLLVAMMLHGTFNLLPTLSVSLSQPFIMLYGYLGFMVPFFFAVVGFAIALRGWEGRIAERILPFYVRTGWFAPPEVAALGSLGRRHSARQWARRVAGPAGQRAMKSFQFAATQLALLRDGMQRGLHRTPASLQRAEAEEQRLLGAIVDYRSTFAGRDPQMPQAFWNGEIYQIAFPDGVTRSVSPPEEPVVPVPIKFAQPAYAGYGVTPGGYGAGPTGYPAPGYPAPGYGAPGYGAGYGASAPGYGYPPQSAPGYGPPSYGPPGYGPPSYGPPSYGAPTYGGPASGTPAYGVPGEGGSGYGTSLGYGASGQSASGYGTSLGHGAPGQGMPTYGAPTSGTAAYGTPSQSGQGYGTPDYGTPSGPDAPGFGAPTYGAPASGTPAYGAPGHGTPGYDAPGTQAPNGSSYGAPSYGTPGQAAPGFDASGQGAQGSGGSSYGTPAYGQPDQAAPGYGAPGFDPAGQGAQGQGAPGYGAPGYGTPSYGAPGQNLPGHGKADQATGSGSGGAGYGAGYGAREQAPATDGGSLPDGAGLGEQPPSGEGGSAAYPQARREPPADPAGTAGE
jgi:protease PrsW